MGEPSDGITSELINFILTNVKLELGLEDTSKDALLTLYIDTICHNFLIITNRKVFPEAAKYLMIDLVKDKFDVNNTAAPELQAIQSMSEYDRTVNFGVTSTVAAKLNLIAQKQLEANERLISKFKLLYRT